MTVMDGRFDLIVIGGGPAGVTAALRARELGASVALVERNLFGGTCTNDGCVPVRVLAKAARLLREARRFAQYGLASPPPVVHFSKVLERAQEVVYEMHEKKQMGEHLRESGVEVLEGVGEARFLDSERIGLPDGRELAGHKFLICVGGRARRLPLPGAEYALLHTDVWNMKRLPASVAIVGSGATGAQLATVFNAFGAEVTLVEVAPHLMPTADADVAAALTAAFRQHGIEVLAGVEGVKAIERDQSGDTLVFTAGGQERRRLVEHVIFATGWPGNSDTLNLAAAGVATKGAYIDVDDTLRTSVPHIYAAGDITGRLMLVQTANVQGRRAVENALLGQNQSVHHRHIPYGGFTDPEYAGIGLTEAQARQIADCLVAMVPYGDLDRAVIDGTTVGFAKLIVDRASRRVLGAHVVGEQAVEVVQILAPVMAGDLLIEQLAEIEFAYPTVAAIIGLAARQLARELDLVTMAPSWREQLGANVAEWERQA
ncbi:MAG TPA: NAD(P)/FAD-dependent oxidoreductase [Caldilineaceae bacterium]|nr:NAD(P)/FAD-dependent oxidoreductase [Caldilineaceae bacterium]